MSNGTDKFNMFDGMEEVKKVLHSEDHDTDNEYGEEIVEIVSITMKTDTRKKYAAAVVARSQEEYETYIESFYYETFYCPETNAPYEVKITVLRPEVNPMEMMRPAYAYSTSH